MASQSNRVDHIYYNSELSDLLDYSDMDVEYDFRSKIEDLDNYKEYMKERNLWSDKLEEETELYLKFNND